MPAASQDPVSGGVGGAGADDGAGAGGRAGIPGGVSTPGGPGVPGSRVTPTIAGGDAAAGGLPQPGEAAGADYISAWDGGAHHGGHHAGVGGLSQEIRPASAVLADRIAAALVHHEPGWRLPRHTALARRYNVSTTEIDAALDELTARHLIRRLPDGQLYRASPAEYLIAIEGVPGLSSRADPMGGEIICRSRQASLRQVPEDIGWALGVPPAEPVGVIKMQWTAGGEPAAFSTTYLLPEIAGPFIGARTSDASAGLTLLPITAPPARPGPDGTDQLIPVGEPQAVHVELQPPPQSVARTLRLTAGQPAALVTVRFDDPEQAKPVALTVAVFRPDLFRIVIESGAQPPVPGPDGSSAGAWTRAVEDWDA